MKKTRRPEGAVSHQVLTRSGPTDQGAVGKQGLTQLPFEIAVTNHFEMTAHIEPRRKPGDQSINGDGRTDVLDNVSLRPNACCAREPEHVQHYQGKVLAQSSLLP